MDIEINEVQEIIKNLESSGELSIKEEKYLNVAKLCVQLAAENAALKSKGKELLGEACAVYSKLNKLIDPSIGDFVDGQTLHEFQFVLDVETPATDRIVAGIKADGVDMFVEKCREKSMSAISSDIRNNWWLAGEHANDFAKQLREGGRQMSKSFIVIIRRAWCNEGGHGIEYSSDLIHYETRNGAISHGFRTVDSDDFNIGVIEDGKLISFDWMDKPVGESEDTLAQIAELIGLEDVA